MKKAALILSMLSSLAHAESAPCRAAMQKTELAWQLYATELEDTYHELLKKSGGNGYVGTKDKQAAVELYRIEPIWKRAQLTAHRQNWDSADALSVAYGTVGDEKDPLFTGARQATETMWAACHPEAPAVKIPPRQHPFIALVWRRVINGLPPKERAELDAIDTRNTLGADPARMSVAVADYVVHDIAPFDLETLNLPQWAGRYRAVPRITDKPSVQAAAPQLRDIAIELRRRGSIEDAALRREAENAVNRAASCSGQTGESQVECAMHFIAAAANHTQPGLRRTAVYQLAIGLVRVLTKAAHTPSKN